MDDPFRDPLVIEMEYLFPKMKIFEKGRSAIAGAQRVLVVRNWRALLCRQHRDTAISSLMRFTSFTSANLRIGHSSWGEVR
jgi:hypothetical protein